MLAMDKKRHLTFAERVLENCGQYAVLQLNSSQDAEIMANKIGTYESIETTRKSNRIFLDASGAGTKKIVHEYNVPMQIGLFAGVVT